MADPLTGWCERVRDAAATGTPLCIRAGGTKDFYGNAAVGERLDPREWCGIEDYQPSELVVTVRAGTALATLERELEARGQMLAFEPPHFGAAATVGGCVAAGLAGPRRCAAGPAPGGVRDAVLGARLLDGHGRLLRFGGTVMKNVAGYDVSRVLAGSLGILGVIVDVSLKVLPRPECELTLQQAHDEPAAIEWMNRLAGRPLPLSAACWRDGTTWLRLSGSAAAVRAAREAIGGDLLEEGAAARFWHDLREQQDPVFAADQPLWRVVVPSTAPPLGLAGRQCIEWLGAQRWLATSLAAADVRARAAALGGHATLFRGGDRAAGAFARPDPVVLDIQRRLKAAFDPARVFNRGRLFEDL